MNELDLTQIFLFEQKTPLFTWRVGWYSPERIKPNIQQLDPKKAEPIAYLPRGTKRKDWYDKIEAERPLLKPDAWHEVEV